MSDFGPMMASHSSPEEVLAFVRSALPGEPFDPRSVVFTGSDLRSVHLPDGTRVIVKHIHPDGDWLSRATGGVDRPAEVCRSGVLAALESVVETGVIGVIDYGNLGAVVMRDLSKWLFRPDAWIDMSVIEQLLGGLAQFHERASKIDLPASWCTITERANYCNPKLHEVDRKRHAAQGGASALREALDYLVQRLGGAAGNALARFFDDIDTFEESVNTMTSRRTLLHGDAKLENLGLDRDRLVAVDWGELTGVGPPEFDVVRFAFGVCGLSADVSPPDIYEIYNRCASSPLNDDIIRLASLACMANNGIGNLAQISRTNDPVLKQRSKDRLRHSIDELRRLYPG